jgi:hypothetical protein
MEISNKKILGYILLLIFATGFYIMVMRGNKHENQIIFSNPGYTIGEIIYFSDAKGAIVVPNAITAPAKPSEIKFKYTVNGNDIENNYVAGEFKVPSSGPIAGEKYIVIYLKSNPRKSRMLFEYPLKDNVDFDKYLFEFKIAPPKLSKSGLNLIKTKNSDK